MILSVVVLSLVTAQRLGELVLARRNTQRLRVRGAIEVGAGHYPFIVALHAAWLIGLWFLAWDRPLILWLLTLFIGLQAARVWVIATLGGRQRLHVRHHRHAEFPEGLHHVEVGFETKTV